MNLINHSHQGYLLKTIHQICRQIGRGKGKKLHLFPILCLLPGIHSVNSKKGLLIVFNIKQLTSLHRCRYAMQIALSSIQQYLSVWDHSSLPKNCLFILMQQQLEVVHIETLNALRTIKLAVALITNSNCDYFLMRFISPFCLDALISGIKFWELPATQSSWIIRLPILDWNRGSSTLI